MKFTGQSIGITWTEGGMCQVVALSAEANSLRITGRWSGSTSDDPSARGRAISAALEQLGVTPDHRIVAGGDPQSFGYFDLSLPKLKLDELASAIRLELVCRMPVRRPVDYGFVQMPTGPCVFFGDEESFNDLRTAIANIGAVDSLLPAPLAYRALAIEEPVHIPLPEDDVIVSVDDGKLSLTYGAEQLEAPESLAGHRIDWGETTEDGRAACVPALLVAAYGASERMASDLRNWNGVPESSRPRRGRGLKIAAAIAALFAVACLSLYGVRAWQVRNAKHAWQAEQLARYDNRIREARARIQKLDTLKGIQENLKSLASPAHSFGAQIDALSGAVPKTVWAHSLRYASGRFSVDFVGGKNESPLAAIEHLGMFEEVSTQRQAGPKETHCRTTFRSRNGGGE